MLFGLTLAYWINYGVYFINSAFQWRFPLLFQCVFAVYILVLTVWLPDTPRRLMRRDGGEEKGLIILAKLRDLEPSHARIQREKDGITEAIAIKSEGTCAGGLFKDSGIAAYKSFYLALGNQFMQQMTGEHRVHLHFNTAIHDLQVSVL
jgi:hypothetical protein